MGTIISRLAAWFDDRTGLQTATAHFLFEDIPASAGWPQVFGSVALFLFLIQSVTGVLLAFNYAPTPVDAYNSVTFIISEVSGGHLVRGLHHWGSSLMIIVVFLHMAQVFIFGAYKKPREATWIAGVVLLFLTLSFGLTGYLLPWDNKAYWGTMVTTKIMAGQPLVGPILTRLIGATNGLGVITFSRFYAVHTLILPASSAALIFIHIYLVRRHGIAPAHQFASGGQKFYPKQLYRDFSAVFLTFLCLFLAACFLDVPLERMADATDTSYVPRPEWYFLFLFQLLKLFPGQLELIATLVLPSLATLALFLLPFLRRTHVTLHNGRTRSSGVVAIVFLTWAGFTAAAAWPTSHPAGRSIVSAKATEWAQVAPEVIAGGGYFRSLQCGSCHNLIMGTPKPGPTLGLGGIQHPREWLLQHFNDKSPARDGAVGTALGVPQRNALLIFVASLNPNSLRNVTQISPSFTNGAQAYVANACASCHKVNGIGGDIGPSLNGLANRRSVGWVRAHFQSPRRLSPRSIMPPFYFAKAEEQDLIDYLFSLPE